MKRSRATMDKQPEDRRSGHVRSAVEDRPAGPERYPAAIASAAILFAAVFPQPCRLGAFIGQPF